MSEKLESWSALLEQRSQTLFVGRQRERTIFRRNFAYDLPEYLLFAVQGPTGVGKSTLMAYYQSIAAEHGALTAQVNGDQATAVYEQTVLQTMAHIAQQLAEAGVPLTTFDEHYRQYLTDLKTIADDPDAPANIFALWQDNASPEEEKITLASEAWDTYLHEKLREAEQADINRPVDKVSMIKSPVKTLTHFFIQDLNKWTRGANEADTKHPAERSQNARILLCFDDWERTGRHLDNWLRGVLLEGRLSTNIWVVIASQTAMAEPWALFHPIMTTLTLQPFTEQETTNCLESLYITDTRRHADIWTFSEGLPILVHMLASATGGQAGDLALSTVDRYLKWLETPRRQETVLQCATARFLNADVFATVTDSNDEALFTWLMEGPLVIEREGDWIYHPTVRHKLLDFAQGHYLQENRRTHQRLKDYYEALLASYADTEVAHSTLYRDARWRRYKLEALYHGLMLGDDETLHEGLYTFLIALHTYYPLAGEILMTWQQATEESARAAVSTDNLLNEWGNTLELGWHALENYDWEAVLKFCNIIIQRQYELAIETREEIHALHTLAERKQKFHSQGAMAAMDTPQRPPETQEEPPTPSRPSTGDTEPEASPETSPPQPATPQATEVAHPSDQTSEEEAAVSPPEKGVGQETSPSQTPEATAANVQKAVTDQAQETTTEQALEPSPDQTRETSSAQVQEPPPDQETKKAVDIKLPHSTYANWMEYMQAEGQERAEAAPQLDTSQLDDETAITPAPETADATEAASQTTTEEVEERELPYTSWEEVEQAIDEYTRKFDPNPAYAVAYNNRANAYFDLGEIEKAIQEYSKAIEINPQYAVAYNNRGLAHAQLGHYQQAIEDYAQAIAIHPHYATAYNNRGLVKAHQGNYTQAIEDYDQAITHNPEDASAYNNRANAYYSLKKYEEAIVNYDQAIARDSTFTAAYINRGLAYTRLQDYERAIEDYKAAIELAPENDTVHSYCGFAYTRLQQYKRALEAYGQAIALNPQNAKAYNQRGLVHAKLEDHAQAIAEYEKAVTLNPQYATAYYNAACAAALMGDEEQACTWLEKAIALDEKYLTMAQRDNDFDTICNAPEFQALTEN